MWIIALILGGGVLLGASILGYAYLTRNQPEWYSTGWTEHPYLTRQLTDPVKFPVFGVMGHPENAGRTQSYDLRAYRYWCQCGTELTDGPRGGDAVNAVCEKCKLNYGCLPGYWGS